MITLIDVCKSFHRQKVLDGLTLTIAPEKISVIIGQSGSGKSVLLKHIIALMRPDSGHIFVDGVDITEQDEKTLGEIRKNFGMLFQGAALFDSMTVGQNVGFPIREHTDRSESEINDIVHDKLRQVGLTDVFHKMPSELSGGMRKRVGLARAIAIDPRIILFDEPTTGLDPIMRDAIENLIVQTQQQTQATCVVISHDIDSSLKMAHFVAMISKGKIIEVGTPDEIRESKNPLVRQFVEGKADGNGPVKVPADLLAERG
jgi:phospholipid/cholesterol/gamma-HCH transport system ATP-binding protein